MKQGEKGETSTFNLQFADNLLDKYEREDDKSEYDFGASADGEKRRIVIVFLRNDLRIHDNASFYNAHNHKSKPTHILPVYCFDERIVELSALPGYHRRGPEARTRLCGFWRTGVFRARFLAEAVYDLRHRLRDAGSDLLIRFGHPEVVLENLVKALQRRGDEVVGFELQKEVCDEEVRVEQRLKARLAKLDIPPLHFNDLKPLINREDLPFAMADTPDVFTPFRKKVEALEDKMVRKELDMPDKFLPFPQGRDEGGGREEYRIDDSPNYGQTVEKLDMENLLAYLLTPLKGSYEMKYADPRFSKHKSTAFPWAGGETAALERLDYYFLEGRPPPVAKYKETRNQLVGHGYSTKLSPYLSIGCISPRRIYAAIDVHEKRYGSSQNTYWVRFEMLWRDYFMYVAEKFGNNLFKVEGFEGITDPKMAEKKKEEWRWWDPDDYLLKAWMRGRTGVPFIDANITELRETGFMSNRGRQNVASFLTKDLYFDWRIGAEFFETHLIDYEPTANWGNWAYVAGVGNDPRASRQFNPIKQARDYDAHGEYVRTWLIQLANVPNHRVHTPWLMSDEEWKRCMPDKQQVTDMAIGTSSARPTIAAGGKKLEPQCADKAGIASMQKRHATSGSARHDSISSGYSGGQSVASLSGGSASNLDNDNGNEQTSESSHAHSGGTYFTTERSSTDSNPSTPSDGEDKSASGGSNGDKSHKPTRAAMATHDTLHVPTADMSMGGKRRNGSHRSPSPVGSDTESINGISRSDTNYPASRYPGLPVVVGASSHPMQFPQLAGSPVQSSYSSATPSTISNNSQVDKMAKEAAHSRNEAENQQHKYEAGSNASSGIGQSATSLMKSIARDDDYLSATPYPRKPLFEQQSWKPHYHRKDHGRRKGGAGGGNSRRLIRAPAEGWEPRA